MRRVLSVAAAVALLLAGFGAAEPVGRRVLNQPAGWVWYSSPRAVYAAGKTYAGFVNGTGVFVGEFDHTAGTWSATQVGTIPTVDDHAAPALGVRPDGRLIVTWAPNGGSVYERISANPGDATAWGATATLLSGQYAYTNLLHLDSGTWWLFSRRYETGGGRTNLYLTSTDDGATWTAPTDWVTSTGRPYAVFAASGNRIDVSISTDHPELASDVSIWHAYWDGQWRHRDGTPLGAGPYTVDQFTKVYDGSTVKGWTWDVAPGPVMTFATFPSTTDHRYQYAAWDGTAWQVHEMTAAGGSIDESGNDPYYSGGVSLDHANPGSVYLSRQTGAGVWQVEHWTTADGGNTWSTQVVSSGQVKNIRPIVPLGGGPVAVFWVGGAYHSYTSWSTFLQSSPDLDAGLLAFNTSAHGFDQGRFGG